MLLLKVITLASTLTSTAGDCGRNPYICHHPHTYLHVCVCVSHIYIHTYITFIPFHYNYSNYIDRETEGDIDIHIHIHILYIYYVMYKYRNLPVLVRLQHLHQQLQGHFPLTSLEAPRAPRTPRAPKAMKDALLTVDSVETFRDFIHLYTLNVRMCVCVCFLIPSFLPCVAIKPQAMRPKFTDFTWEWKPGWVCVEQKHGSWWCLVVFLLVIACLGMGSNMRMFVASCPILDTLYFVVVSRWMDR